MQFHVYRYLPRGRGAVRAGDARRDLLVKGAFPGDVHRLGLGAVPRMTGTSTAPAGTAYAARDKTKASGWRRPWSRRGSGT